MSRGRGRGHVLVVRLPVEIAVEGAIVQLAADGPEDLATQRLSAMLVATRFRACWLPQELLQ